jgi:hypothetical protein
MDQPPKILKFYPYRHARVYGNQKCFTEDIMGSLLEYLKDNSNCGERFPNHTCYEIEDCYGNRFYIMLSDGYVIIGDSIIVGRW